MTRALSIRFPPQVWAQIEARIKRSRRSRNAEVIYLLERAMELLGDSDLSAVPPARDRTPPARPRTYRDGLLSGPSA